MVSLPPRERGGIRVRFRARGERRVMVSLPPRKRGGIRVRFRGFRARGERRVMVSLPPRKRGGIRVRGLPSARDAGGVGWADKTSEVWRA
jgi:hypothetical protein